MKKSPVVILFLFFILVSSVCGQTTDPPTEIKITRLNLSQKMSDSPSLQMGAVKPNEEHIDFAGFGGNILASFIDCYPCVEGRVFTDFPRTAFWTVRVAPGMDDVLNATNLTITMPEWGLPPYMPLGRRIFVKTIPIRIQGSLFVTRYLSGVPSIIYTAKNVDLSGTMRVEMHRLSFWSGPLNTLFYNFYKVDISATENPASNEDIKAESKP